VYIASNYITVEIATSGRSIGQTLHFAFLN